MALLVLLVLTLLTDIVTVQECYNGGIQFIAPTEDNNQITGRVQVCQNNQWATVCRVGGGGEWNTNAAEVTCRQLGYTHEGASEMTPCLFMIENSTYARIRGCNGEENSLEGCKLEPIGYDSCHTPSECQGNERQHPEITCVRANCEDGKIRLVGGSTNREGRVEVCMDGRWGTVCNNSQEGIAGAVCSQLGFPAEGAVLRTFDPGLVPIYSCTFNDNKNLSCNLTSDTTCDHSMDLGVECLRQDVLNQIVERLRQECVSPPNTMTSSPTTNKPVVSTTEHSTSVSQPASGTGVSCDSSATGALGAVIGVLLVLLVALVIGWTVSCVVVSKQISALKTQDSNLNEHNSEPSTVRQVNNPIYDTNEQPHPQTSYSASGPAYELAETNEGAGHAYDVINRNVKQNVPRKTTDSSNQDPAYSVLGQATGGEEHNYHVLEGPQASAYEVPESGHAHSRV